MRVLHVVCLFRATAEMLPVPGDSAHPNTTLCLYPCSLNTASVLSRSHADKTDAPRADVRPKHLEAAKAGHDVGRIVLVCFTSSWLYQLIDDEQGGAMYKSDTATMDGAPTVKDMAGQQFSLPYVAYS